ncbi:MAG: DUF2207 domain-containing protein [Sphaerochaetaceae bacterium]|nr:DUF2207 domain-containing protein [Spirochaetales bacterium]MDY5500553.1 DUF2207 domain-containing protein [Sphaerochaetaceae bacterium]
MKRLFALLGALFLAGQLFAADFLIDSFHLDVQVDRANSYQITQALDIDFLQPRHGFVQDIPLRFGRKQAHITDIRSSEPLQVDLSDPAWAELRVGDASTLVSGEKRYLLSYTYTVGSDGHDDYDEVYLNLIGTDWDAPILQGSFSLTLPKDPGGEPKAWLTYGSSGSTAQAPLSYDPSSYTFTGAVKNLGQGRGMTIRIELPEGYFDEVVPDSDTGSKVLLAAFVLAVLLCGLAFLLWDRYGRDDLTAPVVDWHAPDGLSPLEVGYLYDGVVDGRDLTGMFFYWADQGCLSMKELHKGLWQLTKLKEPEGERAFEREFFGALFKEGDGSTVTTRDIQTESFAMACQKVRQETKRYFRGERALKDQVAEGKKLSIQLFLLVPIFLGAVGATWGYPDASLVFLFAVGLLGELLVAKVVHGYLLKADEAGFVGKLVRLLWALVLVGLGSAINFAIATGYQYLSSWQGILVALSTVVLPSLMSAIAQATERRSAYASRLHSRVLGFRDFIDKVEMDKLRMLVAQTPELFFHILGYAMAMDLDDKWARTFERLGERMLSPGWLETSSPIGSYLVFAAIGRQMMSPVRAGMVYREPPHSSGPSAPVHSFGGYSGHVGGGFGGGGGRSW